MSDEEEDEQKRVCPLPVKMQEVRERTPGVKSPNRKKNVLYKIRYEENYSFRTDRTVDADWMR